MTEPSLVGRAGSPGQRQNRTDAGELLLAELAARRIRLREILGLVHSEVARQMASQQASHMPCRGVVKPRLRAAS